MSNPTKLKGANDEARTKDMKNETWYLGEVKLSDLEYVRWCWVFFPGVLKIFVIMLYTGINWGFVTLESQEGSFNSNNNKKEKMCA